MSNPTGDREFASPMAPGVGPVRELNELRAGSAASLVELREFLAKLKGRKPQEVIGIVSASMLVQSMAIALAIVVGLLILFTLGPYLIYGPPQSKQAASATSMPVANQTAEPVAAPENTAAANAASNTSSSMPDDKPKPGEPDLKRGTQAMGLDEAKQADPKKNPLDSPDLDKLLDGIDR